MDTSARLFSVIIPTYNEALVLASCLEHLRRLNPHAEIIVADGGSSDNTTAIAGASGAVVLSAPRNRGMQLNVGATYASGSILVFLHADVRLPEDAFEQFRLFFRDRKAHIGMFRAKVDIDHWILRWYAFCSRFDSVFTKFGSHCIVVRKTFFQEIGGFPHLLFLEDVRFLQKARRSGRIYIFPSSVVTSGRRFLLRGIMRQYFFDVFTVFRYLCGVPPPKLMQRYAGGLPGRPFTAVVVFTRFPHSGRVKTRLAQTIGDEAALFFHKKCAEHTFSEIRKLKIRHYRYLFVTPEDNLAAAKKWAGRGFFCFHQAGGDLGERIKTALRTTLYHGANKAIILGTDAPDVSANLLQEAQQVLDSHDMVIGPSRDGGYYLLGLKQMHDRLFEGISWSTASVLEQTLVRAERERLRVYRLPALGDIDTQDDLRQWLADAQQDRQQLVAKIVPECVRQKEDGRKRSRTAR